MSEARFAEALSRLDENKQLRLPLRRGDILGRLALRFLWRRGIKWQVESNLAIRDALGNVREIAEEQRSALAGVSAAITEISDHSAASRDGLRAEIEELRRSDQNMMAGLNQRLYAAIGSVRSEIGDLRLQVADKQEHAGQVEARLDAIENDLATLVATARESALRHARLDSFLDAARTNSVKAEAVPGRPDFLELSVSALLDGPAELARSRRAEYLPVVRDARGQDAGAAVFDVAPGRGEWLEVLRGEGIPFVAASTNPVVVDHCAELGLAVRPESALDALTASPRRSLAAVTAFRYAERQTPDDLARFVEAAALALRPGGVLLVETPLVGADFHVDPFAIRPVHPTFARYLAESAGFAKVEIREVPATARAGAEHYCLIAWR